MRKLLLLLTLSMFIYAAKAQLGIQAGADLYASKITSNNISIKYDYKPGFIGGVFYSIPLQHGFSITPELDFVQKGGKINIRTLVNGVPVAEQKSDIRLNYLQLPVNVMYMIKGFFIAAGPTLGVGISGNEKYYEIIDSINTTATDKIQFGNSEDDDLKRVEVGFNIIAGYKLSNGLFINATYNLGLSNIAPGAQSDSKFHNAGFAVRIGYMFKSKKKTPDQ